MAGPTSESFDVGGVKHDIDKYMLAGATKRPVVLIAHGVDGLGGASGTAIQTFAEQIAADGYLVFVPHYFDTADGPDSASIETMLAERLPRVGLYLPRIAAAVQYALRHHDSEGGGLGLIGLSLGGGLVLDYAESAPTGQVKAVVDFFGYVSDPRIYANAGRLPPTLILHNVNDPLVKVVNSSQPLLAALDKTTVTHAHTFYSDHNPARRDHPFLPGGHADIDSRSQSLAWLKNYLKPGS